MFRTEPLRRAAAFCPTLLFYLDLVDPGQREGSLLNTFLRPQGLSIKDLHRFRVSATSPSTFRFLRSLPSVFFIRALISSFIIVSWRDALTPVFRLILKATQKQGIDATIVSSPSFPCPPAALLSLVSKYSYSSVSRVLAASFALSVLKKQLSTRRVRFLCFSHSAVLVRLLSLPSLLMSLRRAKSTRCFSSPFSLFRDRFCRGLPFLCPFSLSV